MVPAARWLAGVLFAFGFLAVFLVIRMAEPPTPSLRFKPTSFDNMPGWAEGPRVPALIAFQRSCAVFLARDPGRALGGTPVVFGTAGDWRDVCAEAMELPLEEAAAGAFFGQRFVPHQVVLDGETEGLFTGYYEPELKGSLIREGPYQTPLHGRPADLVSVDLGAFRDHLKGERIAGRVVDGRLVPYEPRAALADGEVAAAEPLLYVDDPVDAFFLHIQGSGRVRLTDGRVMRLGYAAQNGHVYTAIGRTLVERGALTRDTVSMQSIRAWLAAHPEAGREVMNENRSYIFFTMAEIGANDTGPLGSLGVGLTPEASLAIDRRHIALGVPVFLSGTAPSGPDGREEPFHRLMVAQDTGGAIRGAIRGDVFWGFGPRAAEIAGRMQHPGELTVLLPAPLATRLASGQ